MLFTVEFFLIQHLFFVALDFPEHMNEKNTRVVSKLLAFFLIFLHFILLSLALIPG